MIIETILMFYFVGLIYGVLDTALGKNGFFLFLGIIIASIIHLSTGGSMNTSEVFGFSNWWYFALIPAMLLGMSTGKKLFEHYKKMK